MNVPHQPLGQAPPNRMDLEEEYVDGDDPFLIKVNNIWDDDLEQIWQRARENYRPPTPLFEDLVAPNRDNTRRWRTVNDGVQIWEGRTSPEKSQSRKRKANRDDVDAVVPHAPVGPVVPDPVILHAPVAPDVVVLPALVVDFVPDAVVAQDVAGPSQLSKAKPSKLLKDKLTDWDSRRSASRRDTKRLDVLFNKDYFKDTEILPSQFFVKVHTFLAKCYDESKQEEVKEVEKIFEDAGYCCGQLHFHQSKRVECHKSTAEKKCIVKIGKTYHEVRTRETIKLYCSSHFKSLSLSVDCQTVEKTSGVEDLKECDECGRYFHSSCRTAGLLEGRGCKCGVPTEQLMSPEDLPETDESIAMQYQLKDLAEGSIRIRIFMSDELHEKLEVEGDEQSAVKLWGKNITQFLTKREESIDLSYRRKLVLAFGKPAGDKYLTFFAMMTREYGPNCHPAKAGEIGLEYLDSVQFFDKQERSQIYHSILNSYFKCAKDRGFSVVKFWACPPLPTTEYLFLGHPKQQLNPTEPRLIQFYQDMIASGAHIYSASNGLLITPQREVVEVIMNAFENNAMMFRIIFDGIKKYNEQLRKKSGDSSAEKFRECLQTAARSEHNVLFNLILRDNPAAIEIPKTANYLQMAESSYNFREIQFLEGMDFGTVGSNIASTSKLTKIILRSITPQNK